MTDQCPRAFDEIMVSGYLDGELTQAAAQKARLHLEDCEHCRAMLADLRLMRETTLSTEFSTPDDDQWNERPRGTVSFISRGMGWVVAIVWLVAITGYGLWAFWQSSANLFGKLLVFGGLSAFILLFLSVVLDRISTARTDPYREVER